MRALWKVVLCLNFLALTLHGFGQIEPENCCFTCECYFCGSVAECESNPIFSIGECQSGGSGNCGFVGAVADPACSSWTENNATLNPFGTTGNNCVPIDGGLVFLIAGGLGMAFTTLRKRESLHLELS